MPNKEQKPDVIHSDNGIILSINKNEKVRNNILKRLEITGGYCPCVSEQNEDTICPCKEIRVDGICHCNLYKQETE